jgi:hypothetical protein
VSRHQSTVKRLPNPSASEYRAGEILNVNQVTIGGELQPPMNAASSGEISFSLLRIFWTLSRTVLGNPINI